MDNNGYGDNNDMYGHWPPAPDGNNGTGNAAQLTPDDITMLQAATGLPSSGHNPSSMLPGQHVVYSQHENWTRQSVSVDNSYSEQPSFAQDDSQMLDREGHEDANYMATTATTRKTNGSRTSANNEAEMRQLFLANQNRSIQEVAGELHGNDRGPNSERTRQIFAMLWIDSVCDHGKGSVPRGRVYANYAARCAQEKITVLNPASFGKLVRVLFPGLKTRRLGVRGESKYHYVNFDLKEDVTDSREASEVPQPGKGAIPRTYNAPVRESSPKVKRPAPAPLHASKRARTSTDRPSSRASFNSRSVYVHPDLGDSLSEVATRADKVSVDLYILGQWEDSPELSSDFTLPPIETYLPNGTDKDAAKSLSALYLSHCTSLVECIRYCRAKSFFHHFSSFMGTLTMPVQKLWSNPALAGWIEKSDTALYRRMTSIITSLTLQVLPKPVLDILSEISDRLLPHIHVTFQGQPDHVLQAKVRPASMFNALLLRALRVNITAHAAANQLCNPANRDQMYVDWLTMIRPRKIAESVPAKAMDDVVDVLIKEMRHLINPANVPFEVECLTIYGDSAIQNTHANESEGGDDGTQGKNVLDRWVALLKSLPERFPYASAGELVVCVDRIGTTVMRELTMSQGKSFGSWWVTKVWLDEMFMYMAEQGGFMKGSETLAPDQETSTGPVSEDADGSVPSPTTAGTNEGGAAVEEPTQSQPDRAPFPPAALDHQPGLAAYGPDLNDDSGISIRTPDEEFNMDKFTFTGTPSNGEL